MGRLAGKTGKTIAFKHNDTNALVREVWVLTDDEASRFTAQKEVRDEVKKDAQ